MNNRERLTKQWKTVETATKAAELVWTGRSAQEAAVELGLNRNQLFALLSIARQSGFLRPQAEPHRYIEPVLAPELGNKLVDIFSDSGLRSALVVEVPRQLSCYRGYANRLDRSLHVLLGRSAIRHVSHLDADPSIIGVGGGRAVSSLVREVVEQEVDLPPSCQVQALSGGIVWPYLRDSERLPAPSDLVALEFWGGLSRTGRWLERPLLNLQPPLVPPERAHKQCEETPPDIAIFGIGAVSSALDHFMVADDFVASAPDDDIKGALIEIKRLLAAEGRGEPEVSHSGGFYHPLVEILNTVAVVRPPDSVQAPLARRHLTMLEDAVQHLNRFSNGLSHEQLTKVPLRLAIAGGLHKTFQVWWALKNNLVSHLVTDALTGEALIRLSRSRYAEADASMG